MRSYKGIYLKLWTIVALMAIFLLFSAPSSLNQINEGRSIPYRIHSSDVASDLDDAWGMHDQLIVRMQNFENWFQADLSPAINDINQARIHLENAEEYIEQLNDVAAAIEVNLAEEALSNAKSRLEDIELNQSTTILLVVSILIIIIITCMVAILYVIKFRKKIKQQRERELLDSKIDYDAMKQAGIID
jgi:hypothetical protein